MSPVDFSCLPKLTKKFSDLISGKFPFMNRSGLSIMAGGIIALTPAAARDTTTPAPSPPFLSRFWRRGDKSDPDRDTDQFILEASTDNVIEIAGHRSHRSHASHYSSRSGHRSHSSHYSSYQSRTVTPPTTTIKTQPSTPRYQAPKIVLPKTGIVKATTSSSTIMLINGDSIKLKGVKVFQALDKEAHNVLRSFLSGMDARMHNTSIKSVVIRYDDTMQTEKPYEAYVFIYDKTKKRNVCANVTLIERGLATFDESQKCSESAAKALKKAEKDAKSAGVGLWKDTNFSTKKK